MYDSRSESLLVFPTGVIPKFSYLLTITDTDYRVQMWTQAGVSSCLAQEKWKLATWGKSPKIVNFTILRQYIGKERK